MNWQYHSDYNDFIVIHQNKSSELFWRFECLKINKLLPSFINDFQVNYSYISIIKLSRKIDNLTWRFCSLIKVSKFYLVKIAMNEHIRIIFELDPFISIHYHDFCLKWQYFLLKWIQKHHISFLNPTVSVNTFKIYRDLLPLFHLWNSFIVCFHWSWINNIWKIFQVELALKINTPLRKVSLDNCPNSFDSFFILNHKFDVLRLNQLSLFKSIYCFHQIFASIPFHLWWLSDHILVMKSRRRYYFHNVLISFNVFH